MSSDRQIAANKQNALRSTGPCTPAGKAKISVNALKHGLTGRQIVLPNENPDDFDSFRGGLFTDLGPQGELESALVEKLVSDIWRLRRVPILEAALHRRGFQEIIVEKAVNECSRYERNPNELFIALADKKEVAPNDRRAHEEAQQRLEHARAQLHDASYYVTRALQMFPSLFSRLDRHETALARSMQRTLHELQRLQAKRAGENISPPSILDVDVSRPESVEHPPED